MGYKLVYYSYEAKKYGSINFQKSDKVLHLKDIVDFTSQFAEEFELKNYLIDNNLLKKEYLNYNIGIISVGKKGKKLLDYGPIYNSDLQYTNIAYIKNYFQTNINNTSFLEYFLNKYYNYLINVHAFNEDLLIINAHYNSLLKSNYPIDEVNKYLEEFLNRYIYRKNAKTNKITINYRQVIEMGMFIKNYEEELLINNIHYEELEKEYNNYLDIIKEGNITDEDYNAYNIRMNKIDQIMIKRRMKGNKYYGVTKD